MRKKLLRHEKCGGTLGLHTHVCNKCHRVPPGSDVKLVRLAPKVPPMPRYTPDEWDWR